MHPPFPQEGDLGVAKNYWVITLRSFLAKIYNALLHNCIEPKIEKILRKNQNGFWRNQSMTSQILTIHQILEGVRGNTIIYWLLLGIWLHTEKEDGANTSHGLPKETVAAIMLLYKNTKGKIRSPDGDTDYFYILAGVLQGDTLALYLFIICLDYRFNERKQF